MPQVPYELTQGLNVVSPGIREGADVKTYPNLQAEQMVESGRQMVSSGTHLKIMMDQVVLDRAETNAKNHDNIIADEIRVRISDPKTGFTALSGKSAVDQRDQSIDSLNKYVKAYVADIKDPLESGLVSRAANARLQHAYQTIDSHSFTQGKVYKEAVFTSSIQTKTNDIAAATLEHYNNPSTRNGVLSTEVTALTNARNAEMEQHFADLGIDKSNPIYKNAFIQADTKLAQDIVGNWVNQGKTSLARGYLEANKKQIDQTAMNQMTRLVDVAALSKGSVVLANTLPGSFVDKQNKLDSMLKNESISDDLYRATSQQINKLESEYKQRTSDNHANIESAAYQALTSNPFMKIGDLPAAQQLDIDSVPGLLGKLNKYDRDGKRFNTDADIYNALVTTSPKDLAKISDSEFNNKFRSLLSNADYADILARRAVGLGADTKGGVNIVSTQDQITYSLKDAGILEEKGAKNIKQQEQAYSLTLQIQKQIKAEEVSIGAKNGLTENKIQGIIDRVILDDKKNKIERPGRFFGSSEVTLSSLSKQQQQVINQMNAMGIPLTRENQEKAMLQAGIK
jgi:hypothetical protein